MRCRVCTDVRRSAIEKACRRSTVADVAALYVVNENALVRHLAAHGVAVAVRAPAKKKKLAAKPAVAPRSQPAARTTAPANVKRYPLSVVLEDPDDDDAPLASRSAPARTPAIAPTVTARASLDEILKSIREIMKSVQSAEVPFGDKASALRVALQAVRLLAGLTGELGATESTVASSPYFRRMLQIILEAVRGSNFSEARQAILDALEREERGNGRQDQAAE